MVERKIRTLLFSSLYPSSVRPGHGIFVETRLRELLASNMVEARVVSPVPWFFSAHPRFGDYARMARTPLRETYNGVDVQHPRYFLPPKVGMNIAPFTLAMGAVSAVKRILKEGYEFDLIDAHYYYPDGVAAALLGWYFNKPFVVTARGSDINLIADCAIPRKLMRWTSGRACASIGVSSALTSAMKDIGMPPEKIVVMPNGVDLQIFRPQPRATARLELGWPDSPTLISVGNLVENKGHHFVIEALVGLPEFRLAIAGEGPEFRALKTLANQLNVSTRVQFLGRLDQRQLALCYSAADVLVLASSREGWPNVLLESMACGTPVVATNVGGVPEIVSTSSVGRLMMARTVADIVASVHDLWGHPPDRNLVRMRAQLCGWQSTTLAQVNLFNGIAGAPTGEVDVI